MKKVLSLSDVQLSRLAGTYAFRDFRITVTVESGALAITSPLTIEKVEFLPESETLFFSTNDGLPNIKFAVGPDGGVNELDVFGNKAKRVQ
jgi:hypothetical protein